MADLYDEILHFSHGVVTSAELDSAELKNALVRADNAQFTSVAGRKAVMRKREGLSLVNSTPVNNSSGSGPAIIGGFAYRYESGGTRTNYMVVVTDTGNVHLLVDDGSSSSITPTASLTAPLNTGLTGAVGVEMNNRLFLFDRKGGALSLLGTTNVGWGVTPVTGLALAQTGVGSMTGDYDVVVTKYDSRIDEESEVSAEVSTTGMAAEQLQVTVNAVANTETHLFYRVYLRKPSIGTGFYRVLAGTGYNSTYQGFPLYAAGATTNTTINVSDSTLEDAILTAPRVNSKGLPPSSAKYAAVYQRRLFVADDENLYWSELDHPDSFNPLSVEPITSPKGGLVKGLVVTDQGLQILTETARHYLVGGTDPKGWVTDVVDPDVGLVNSSALVSYRKHLAMWAGTHFGPVMIGPTGETAFIGTDRIRDDVIEHIMATSAYDSFLAAGYNGRLFFGTIAVGQTKVQSLLVFNLEMGAWESTNWDPMDIASLFVASDSSGTEWLYIGNHNGQLFRAFDGSNDGVRTGTVSGTFVAGSSSISSITDGDATFDTTGAGLKERRVVLLNSDGEVVETSRVKITANTATELTLSSSISVTSGATYTYLVGGPNFRIETYWGHMGVPFINKRFDVLYTEFRADAGVSNVAIEIAFGWDELQNQQTNSSDQASELWDTGYWDVTNWDGLSTLTRRIGVIQTGINYRIKVQNPYPDQGFAVLKLAVLARQLTDRYAGSVFR